MPDQTIDAFLFSYRGQKDDGLSVEYLNTYITKILFGLELNFNFYYIKCLDTCTKY